MKRTLILLLIGLVMLLLFSSCIDYTERLVVAQKKFPGMVIYPATGLIAENGYEFIAEDTVNHKIYAIMFGAFSTKRIDNVRNIK